MKDVIYGKDSDGLIVTETMVLELLADIIYASKQKNNAGDQYFLTKLSKIGNGHEVLWQTLLEKKKKLSSGMKLIIINIYS